MNDSTTRTILAVGAHPDDIEILGAGTLVLLKDKGWKIECATMTPGDCGSTTLGRDEISRIRKSEAAASAALLQANYHCLGCDDIFISYDRPTLLKAIKLVRQVKPAIVFTMSPQDYMVDHELTSRVIQTACFSAGIANIPTDGTEPFLKIPCLYYFDPIEGKDNFGTSVRPTTIVDITSTMATKEKMFRCHASQQSWLKAHHEVDDYINSSLKELSAKRGREIGVSFAEGFRQHLGHAYPQENILKQELAGLVHVV
jgi:LmbE family N-acetylglucosaminyl deacetylase